MVEPDKPLAPAAARELVSLQAKVCYMNVDRTLATWTRTSLALIVFGAVVDRFGLLLRYDHLPHAGTWLAPNPISSIGGIILVAFGVFIALTAAVRHQLYRAIWQHEYGDGNPFGPWLAFANAVMVVLLGSAVLAALLLFAT
jgi:uncharacterized membrane protein YidH (DUF202 family)